MYNWSLKEKLPFLKTVGVNRIRSLKNPFSDQSNSKLFKRKKNQYIISIRLRYLQLYMQVLQFVQTNAKVQHLKTFYFTIITNSLRVRTYSVPRNYPIFMLQYVLLL